MGIFYIYRSVNYNLKSDHIMTDNELETFSVEALNKSSNNFIVTEISSSSLRCKRKLIQKRSIDCF